MIKIPKNEFVEQWTIQDYIKINPEIIEDLGDELWVSLDILELNEDFTRTIQHPTGGTKTITIPKGKYYPPYYNENYLTKENDND